MSERDVAFAIFLVLIVLVCGAGFLYEHAKCYALRRSFGGPGCRCHVEELGWWGMQWRCFEDCPRHGWTIRHRERGRGWTLEGFSPW